jgi:hypothetical protein
MCPPGHRISPNPSGFGVVTWKNSAIRRKRKWLLECSHVETSAVRRRMIGRPSLGWSELAASLAQFQIPQSLDLCMQMESHASRHASRPEAECSSVAVFQLCALEGSWIPSAREQCRYVEDKLLTGVASRQFGVEAWSEWCRRLEILVKVRGKSV